MQDFESNHRPFPKPKPKLKNLRKKFLAFWVLGFAFVCSWLWGLWRLARLLLLLLILPAALWGCASAELEPSKTDLGRALHTSEGGESATYRRTIRVNMGPQETAKP